MRWLRKIWVGLLAGLALLTASCFRIQTPRVYGPPPVDDSINSKTMNVSQRKAVLKQRLDSIRVILKEREGEEVYGSPEIIEEHNRESNRLIHEANAIEKELEDLDR